MLKPRLICVLTPCRYLQQDGNKLRQCIFPLKGRIEWWSHQMPKKSMGLAYSVEQNTIVLGEGETTGKITGCFHLPKRCFYKIHMSACIQRTVLGDAQGGETAQDSDKVPEDWKLYVGPEMDSLQHHTFRDLGGKVRTKAAERKLVSLN
jgi:hypothetical protein